VRDGKIEKKNRRADEGVREGEIWKETKRFGVERIWVDALLIFVFNFFFFF